MRFQGSVATGSVLTLLGVLAWRSIGDTDLGIHLAGGRWIAEHLRVPSHDPFTFTVSDHAEVAYHWLFQLGAHMLYERAGALGLVVARWILLMGTGLLVADLLRLRRVSALSGAVVGVGAVLASEWRFTLRPELASWALAAATLWVVERRRSGRPAPLWLLPLIQLAWVNLHVYLLGFAILGIYAADECWRRRTLRTPLVGWSALAFVATLANPYGLEAVRYPLTLATRFSGENTFARNISELASPFSIARDPRNPFSTGVQLSAYRLLLLLGLVALLLHGVRRRFVDAALLAVFGLLAALAVRNVVLFAVVATPSLCVALDDLLGEGRRQESAARRGVRALLLAATLAYALLLVPRVVSGVFYAEGRRLERFAAVLCRDCLALDTADWLARSGLEGRGLNNLVFGGTLSWRDPGHPIFIDGRNEVTGEAFYADYLRAMDPANWAETQRRWSFEYVALAHRGAARAQRLAAFLAAAPSWTLAHVDGGGVVFVRAAGPNGERPAPPLPAPVSPNERAQRLADLSAVPNPWLWSRVPAPGPSLDLGLLLLAMGRADAAERPLLDAAETHPGFVEPLLILGADYQEQGRPGPALRAFRLAYALAPDHPDLAPLHSSHAGERP